jgi:hypothetical protein
MRTLAALPLLAVLALAAAAHAQTTGPALVVTENDEVRKLHLAKVEVEARILGDLAQTKMTLVFANPEERELEGDLYFPLPDGATVCGYALDIGGKMIDGVVVERDRARNAYETITSRRKDPALLELVQGNTFRARVFPIPSKGTRTITLWYVGPLAAGANGSEYRVPLGFADKVDEFSVLIEAGGMASAPKVLKGGPTTFAFAKGREGYVAEAKEKQATLKEPLVIAMPRAGGPDVLTEKGPDGIVYFCIRRSALPPEEPPAAAKAPKRITVLWDASGSRAAMDHARELRLLATMLAKFDQAAVDLVIFRHEAEKPQHFAVREGRTEAMTKVLEAVDYDGATQLSVIAPAAGGEHGLQAAPGTPPDLVLLFTDGLSTYGKDHVDRLGAPVVIVAGGEAVDPNALQPLVLANGGAYVNLNDLTDAQAAAAAGKRVLRYHGTTVTAGHAVDLCPAQMETVTETTTILGRLEGHEAAALTIRCSRTDKEPLETKVIVSGRDAPQGNLLRRLWAARTVAELSTALQPGVDQPNINQIAEMGKQYGIVTSQTSLIVLENLQQHIQYGIRPPDMLPEMQKAYDAKMVEVQSGQPAPESMPPEHQPPMRPEPRVKEQGISADPSEEQLYDVLVPWYFRLAAWDEEHEVPPNFKYTATGTDSVASGGIGSKFMSRMRYGGYAGYGFGGGSFGATGGWGGGGGSLFSSSSGVGGGATLGGSSGAGPEGTGEATGGTVEPPLAATPDEDAADTASNPPTVSVRIGTATGTDATSSAGFLRYVHTQAATITPEQIAERWNPDKAYLKAIEAAPPDKVWAVYMAQRKTHALSPTFFLDAAHAFFVRGDAARGLQVLSNLAELGETEAMRTEGFRLIGLKMPGPAARVFEEVAEEWNGETAATRDLAMILAAQGQTDRAVELLAKIILDPLQGQSEEVRVTALVDLNLLLAKAAPDTAKRLKIDRRLIHKIDGDLRIVATWDADDVDVDLAVTEPTGEKCYYDHAITALGGSLWMDVTGGLGPEEYLLRQARAGKYKIEVTWASTSAERSARPVLVLVDIWTNFGRPTEQHEQRIVALEKEEQTVTVKELELPRPAAAAEATPGTR